MPIGVLRVASSSIAVLFRMVSTFLYVTIYSRSSTESNCNAGSSEVSSRVSRLLLVASFRFKMRNSLAVSGPSLASSATI